MAKNQGARNRPPARTVRRPTRPPPLTRLVVLAALHGWVVPVVALVIGFAAFILYSTGVIEEAAAVTTVGMAAVLTVLFFGLRNFFQERIGIPTVAALVTFGLLWAAAAGYPLYRAVNPGTPLFSGELKRNGPVVTLPFHHHPGHYGLTIEGHFLPAEGHANRTAAYKLLLGHDGSSDRVIQGAFSQTWGTQRVGSGRRSSIVPSLREVTLVREGIDNPRGTDLTLQLSDLSPGVRDGVTVRLYSGGAPLWVWIAIGLLALVGAIVVDAGRPRGANEGLMTTMTVATLVAIMIFRASSAATPGFPQLAVAALMGTLAGAVAGTLIWRLAQPVRKLVGARR